jgi:hypothetical protein
LCSHSLPIARFVDPDDEPVEDDEDDADTQ